MIQFSFIIPVFNCMSTLRGTVDSIHAIYKYDSNLEYEIILVDDGSRDQSGKLCDEIEKFDSYKSKITVIHQENAGVSAARNRGIKAAVGEYLIFIDSDDTVDASLLIELMKKMKDNPEVDMGVFGISFDYYLNGKCYRRDEVLPALSGIIERKDWEKQIQQLFDTNSLSSMCNKIYRKRIFEEFQLSLKEDMIILEDLCFNLEAMWHCDRVYFFQKAIYHYYHEGHYDHAGKRLQKIPHLNMLIDRIRNALMPYEHAIEEQKHTILLTLYKFLAYDKLEVSSYGEIQTICKDFHCWIDENKLTDMIAGKQVFESLYYEQCAAILFRRKKAMIRHRTANIIKRYIGDFRKWEKTIHH